MANKTQIEVVVYYENATVPVNHVFDEVNKAANYQLSVMNAVNVLSTELIMTMKKDNEYHD